MEGQDTAKLQTQNAAQLPSRSLPLAFDLCSMTKTWLQIPYHDIHASKEQINSF